jgi:hypothetical protein
MDRSVIVQFDTLRTRTVAVGPNGPIDGTYRAIGVSFAHPARLICITNNTDGDMLFSNDGVSDKLFIPAHSFKLFDLTTNREGVNNSSFFALPNGTIIYVKQSTAATTGAVYVEVIYGQGD